ncbi:hypothetical protein [Micromonospora sp. WMMD1219]|uniref:hypothetical protein n=1 Tax=Micromonospora sp. WMMD1219 TaxID=3404115 RepID=UPI003BF5C868
MARGKKLSDAYLELRADDSKLSPDVKVKARRVAKEFGGQLNRQLAALDIDPIDMKADPRSAITAIETTRERLRALSRDADSVEMRVKTERALSQLERVRKQLGDVDDKPVEPKVDPSPAQRQIGQLSRQLAALGIDPPIALDADPKDALADIARVESELRRLSAEGTTVKVRVDAESTRTVVERLRRQIGDDGGEGAAQSFAARFVARLGPVVAEGPGLAVAGGIIGVALAPAVASVVAAAMIGGAGAGGIIGGVVLASRDARVQAAGKSLGAYLLGDLEARATSFTPAMLSSITRIRAAWSDLGPDLDRIFASSRFMDPLVDGALSGGRKLIGGLADAVEEADPVVLAFGRTFDQVGQSAGEAFTTLSDDADEAASAVDDLSLTIDHLITTMAGILHAGAVVKGWTNELDMAIDKGRYWIEDNSYLAESLRKVGVELDLTADGFKKGSKEAEAMRRASIGTATAADFVILKTAGMTDAQIAAADASGTYRSKIDEVNQALGKSGDTISATEDDVKALQDELDATGVRMENFGKIGNAAFDGLLLRTGAVTGAMLQQQSTADNLRRAHEAMYGTVIAQTEASEGYQAALDDLTSTVKNNADQISRNKNNLDLHSKAGRDNRDALQALLLKSNEMYFADIAAGMAVDEARKKHEKRTDAIRTEAGQLKLNKAETEKLIGTYGNIPPKKTTNLLLDGVDRIVGLLTDLYIFQRSLAEGITLGQAKAAVTGTYGVDPRLLKRTGGEITGQGLRGVDSEVIIAAPGEYMQPVPAVDYYGVAAMDAIRHRRIPREALRGFRTGGLVGAPWSTRLRYETDVRGTRVPSREEVANKVIPAFGAWPSSPAAQRGDSGVWRRIMALVRGSGIPYTFGNAYRPGDPLWHGSGRAVDFMGYNQDRLARLFLGMQSRVLELIHRTDRGDYAISRGRRVSMPTQLPLHRNHLHVAMDEGGYLMPGWNPPIYNGTGRPEPVTTAASMDAVVARLDRLVDAVVQRLLPAVQGIGPGVGVALAGATDAAFDQARLR